MKEVTMKVQQLEEGDFSVIKRCLIYCKHRIKKHGKNVGVTEIKIDKLLEQMSPESKKDDA